MNNPCENKSYRAKLSLSLEIDGLDFTSMVNYEFESSDNFKNYPEYPNYLENKAKVLFINNHRDAVYDFDIKVEVISVNKN